MNYKYLIAILFACLLIIPFSFASDNQTLLDGGAVSSNENSYYFDASCENDNGNGSLENPYKYLKSDRIRDNSNIYLNDGEYLLDKPANINNVSIYGSNSQNTSIIYSGVAFVVSKNLNVENLTLSKLTIRNSANLILKNVILEDGRGYNSNRYNNCYGGAIYSSNSNAFVTIDNCTFLNAYTEYGGAIYQDGGKLFIDNSEFINCSSFNFGGAIAGINTNVRISNSKFSNSSSKKDAGGAVYLKTSSLSASDIQIENSNSTFGSALCLLKTNSVLSNIKANNNHAQFSGGAIYNIYGEFSLNDSEFTNNTARDGGALFIDNSDKCTIINNAFSYNGALISGGAAYIFLCNLTESLNSFSHNHALLDADIHISDSLDLTIGSGNYTMYKVNSTQIDVLPSYYSLIDEKLVTPVKDQQTSGNCWAFAPIAVMESCILKASGDALDLSEENMKNLMALYSDYGWNMNTNDGGYDKMGWGYLTSWLGPVLESDDLFDDNSHLSGILNSIGHVQNIIFLYRANYTDNDAIKRAIMQYGAVGTTMYMGGYLNSKNAYYYYKTSDSPNHAVTIVGWDDNFSKNNFAHTPEGDGAWIVKNSWGSGWGNNGYFYVSYYDTRLAQPGLWDVSFAIVLNDTIRLDKNYQYDIAGMTDYFLNSYSTVWYENAFRATDDEYLASVSTYFEKVTNWTVSIYVNSILQHIQSGVSNPGYYTINLDNLVPLKTGDLFEVMFKISVDGEASFPISEIYSLNNLAYSPNVSFVSYDGVKWLDLYDLSFKYSTHWYESQVACIKAFTILNPINTTSTISYTIDEAKNINVTVEVLDQYSNPLKSGTVALNINGNVYNLPVKNGIASLSTFLNQINIVISALFDATGYISSNDSVSFKVPKSNLPLVLNVSRELNNVSIDFKSLIDANVTLTVKINDDVYEVFLDDALNLNNLSNGIYNVSVSILDEESCWQVDLNDSFVVDIRNVSFIASDLTTTDEDDVLYNITVVDEKGNPLSNKTVTVTLNETFDLTSDENGLIQVPISLKSGNYLLYVDFKGDNDHFKNSTSFNIFVKCKLDGNVEIRKYQNNANFTFEFSKPINATAKVMINNEIYLVDVRNGNAILNLFDLKNGAYYVDVLLNDSYVLDDVSYETQIILSNVTGVDDEVTIISACLMDSNSNPLSNELLIFTLGDNVYTKYTDDDGFAYIHLNLTAGEHELSIQFNGNDNYFDSALTSRVKIKSRVVLSLEYDVYQNSAVLKVYLSKAVNDTVVVKVNDITQFGEIIYLNNLSNGIYNVNVSLENANDDYAFENVIDSFAIDVKKTEIIASELTLLYQKNNQYDVTLKDIDGNAVANQWIEVEIAGNVYKILTDSNGQSSITFNLSCGDYAVAISYSGNKNYFGSTANSTIRIKTTIIENDSLTKTYNSKYAIKLLNTSDATFILNGVLYDVKTDENGFAYINILEKAGEYKLTIINNWNGENITKTINVVPRLSGNSDISKYYLGSKNYQVRVLNDDGDIASDVYVKITVGGKTYNVKTNKNGIATLKLTQKPNKYTITASYNGFKVSNKVVIKTTIITKNLSKKKSKTAKFTVKLLNSNGKILKSKIATIKFKGKTYKVKTNSKGIAKLTINKNIKVGKYNVVTSYGKLTVKNWVKVTK
ncbi:C1 family peptidase [Methanobrevibacter sp. UBA188]|uniref:C1 family peptidase n=1 Tax=Methanobrevibacter sp. UBA188 TaxID=1915473 RepID=UPI0025F074E7|nr:C1 family peptidase [Methanobrevibacter sp. UBA188]